jgi:hypothetical protein
MFQIDAGQVEALDDDVRRRFRLCLAAMMRDTLPSMTAGMTDEQLLERVIQACARAARLGIERECDVTRFVGLSLLAGPDFDALPNVRHFLQAPIVGGRVSFDDEIGDKLDYLLAELAERSLGLEP